MIKSLLVGYDGSLGSRVALQHAVDLAGRCEGRVLLLTAGRGTQPEGAAFEDGGVDVVGLATRRLDSDESAKPQETDELLGDAFDLCRELTVRCHARPAYGDFAFALSRASRLVDLVFIGRDVAGEPGRYDAAARTARRVASGAVCPVMIAAREYEPIRSVLAVCPMADGGGRALRTAAELASLLQVKLEALIVSEDVELAGRWTHEVKRYLVDHGHPSSVLVRKPPLGPHLDGLLTDRQSPLVVVPKGSPLSALRRRDPLADALRTLHATIVSQP